MLSNYDLNEMRKRIEAETTELDQRRSDARAMAAEIDRLHAFLKQFTARIEAQVTDIENDLTRVEADNERLRANTASTYFERDACISLIAQMSIQLGLKVGTKEVPVAEKDSSGNVHEYNQKLVVVDLPAGQVSWEYVPDEEHLFAALPVYDKAFETQTVQDIYAKVMNPALDLIGNGPAV